MSQRHQGKVVHQGKIHQSHQSKVAYRQARDHYLQQRVSHQARHQYLKERVFQGKGAHHQAKQHYKGKVSQRHHGKVG